MIYDYRQFYKPLLGKVIYSVKESRPVNRTALFFKLPVEELELILKGEHPAYELRAAEQYGRTAILKDSVNEFSEN